MPLVQSLKVVVGRPPYFLERYLLATCAFDVSKADVGCKCNDAVAKEDPNHRQIRLQSLNCNKVSTTPGLKCKRYRQIVLCGAKICRFNCFLRKWGYFKGFVKHYEK